MTDAAVPAALLLAVLALAAAVFAIAALLRLRRRYVALAHSVRDCAHNVRGTLSPALLNADRLTRHPDPAVRDAAEAMAQAIERAAKGLQPAVTEARAAFPAEKRA